jgi:hypothetical protein
VRESDPLDSMTVNERLSAAGLLDHWDTAVRARDRNAMLALVRRVRVEAPDFTVDAVLADPAHYGF